MPQFSERIFSPTNAAGVAWGFIIFFSISLVANIIMCFSGSRVEGLDVNFTSLIGTFILVLLEVLSSWVVLHGLKTNSRSMLLPFLGVNVLYIALSCISIVWSLVTLKFLLFFVSIILTGLVVVAWVIIRNTYKTMGDTSRSPESGIKY